MGKTAVTHLYVPVNILPVAWVVQHSQEVLQSAQLSAHYIVFSYHTSPQCLNSETHHTNGKISYVFPSLAKSDSGVRLLFVGFKSVMRS